MNKQAKGYGSIEGFEGVLTADRMAEQPPPTKSIRIIN